MFYSLFKFILPFKVKEFLKYLMFIKYHNFNNFMEINMYKTKFYIPKSDLKLENNIYYRVIKKEEESVDLIKKIHKFFKTDLIIDIGANIGYWSFIRKQHLTNIEQFFCIEPSKISFNFLKKNLKKYNDFKVYNLGLGNSEEVKKLSFPYWENKNSYRIQNLGLRSIYGDTNLLAEEIKIIKFDQLFPFNKFINKSIFIKIDTEGYELEIIKGMHNFISNVKEIILELELNHKIFENISQNILSELLQILKNYNFQVYYYKNQEIIKLEYDKVREMVKKETLNIYFKKINF